MEAGKIVSSSTDHNLLDDSAPVRERAGRRALAGKLLDGYVSGPDATNKARAEALEKVGDARAVVVVEGISDQIALETLAARRGRDLDAEAVVILPIGGAHAITHHLTLLGPKGVHMQLAGLCDAGEEDIFRRGLDQVGFGSPLDRADLERLGFHVCVDDLEDELIRAAGTARVEGLFDAHGDLGSFRTLQTQPPWRGENVEAQMQRFLGSGARRKLRYARALVEAVDLDCMPHPLDAVLADV